MYNIYNIWISILSQLQNLFLLVIRVYWGYNFFLAGKGKFFNFENALGFFKELGIPFPEINLYMAAGTEMICGLLLLLGLGSRIVTVPLIFTMVVAYLTAHKTELGLIFEDTDKFLSAPPFLFMYTSIVVLLFGPGKYSVDELISKKLKKS